MAADSHQAVPLCYEWVGTSQFCTNDSISLQENGHLEELIKYRKFIIHKISKEPYNPAHYIDLSRCDIILGFSDIAAANAHRAILLVRAALFQKSEYYDVRKLAVPIQKTIVDIIRSTSPAILLHELKNTHLKAYRVLLEALLDTAAFWEGLVESDKAKKLFPGDPDILEFRGLISSGFLTRNRELQKNGVEGNELVIKSRMGKVYQKRYPWLDIKLHIRTRSLIDKVNQNYFGLGTCEIKPVVFLNAVSSSPSSSPSSSGDLGPLGIFATRDIHEGELVIVDQCITGMSDIPSSRLEHCDACHASVIYPFVLEMKDIRKPSCCSKVIYCGEECCEKAFPYHEIVCGKDFDWLYADINETSTNHTRWRPIMFLRVIAIILADRRVSKKPIHPLEHPLLAIMTANYASPDMIQPKSPYDWQFWENIEAPTRILLQLGVDIFTEPDFSPEVIQTIYWRLENNASMESFNAKLALNGYTPSSKAHKDLPEFDDEVYDSEGTVHMHCINPQYLFLNHSCDPNLAWHGCNASLDDDISWYKVGGKLMKLGSSTVFVKAFRDIKAGEELKISYIGDPLCENSKTDEERQVQRATKKLWMTKWFDGGCGCIHCEKEKEEHEQGHEKEQERKGSEVDLKVIGREEVMVEGTSGLNEGMGDMVVES